MVLRSRRHTERLVTADVSRHGAFILSDAPELEHELVQLTIEVPEREALEVMATVAHRVVRGTGDGLEADAGHDGELPAGPGMGVDFLALSRSAKDVWDDFIFGLRGRAAVQTEAQVLRRTRRRHARHSSCFLVRLRDKDGLREFYTRDIGAGGARLEMPVPESPTDAVELILVHPDSEQEFQLTGRVRRVELPDRDSASENVAVEFDPLTTTREVALLAFIETGVNYVDEGNPPHEHRALVHAAASRAYPDSPGSLVATGETMLASSDPQLAINAFRTALTLDPRRAAAHLGLHRAYTLLGQDEAALEHWRAYVALGGVSLEREDEGGGVL